MSGMADLSEFALILKPSEIGGVGVFAASDIPAGKLVFSQPFHPRLMKVNDIPKEFLKFVIYLNEEECLAPQRFDRMEIGWYLNHSDTPNITKIAEHTAVSNREIKAGEEIFIDYNQLNEPENLKEDYYRKPN